MLRRLTRFLLGIQIKRYCANKCCSKCIMNTKKKGMNFCAYMLVLESLGK